MRKAVRIILVALAVLIAAALIALPRVAPPWIERFAEEKLAEQGFDAKVKLGFGYCWRNGPGVEGLLNVFVPHTPWYVVAKFGASCCEWSAHVMVSETKFSESDLLVKTLLERYPPKGVSNLVSLGSVALDAKAERAGLERRDVGEGLLGEHGVGRTDGCGRRSFRSARRVGVADHVDIAPMFLCARTKRFEEISKSSGVSVGAVQKRSLKKFDEKIPADSGVWIQDADGTWRQK